MLRGGCSNRPDLSPAQPRRAETRRSAGKAAVPQLTLVSRFTLLWSEPRTKLGACFSIRSEVVLRDAIPECIAGDLEEPACFGNIPVCALQRFL